MTTDLWLNVLTLKLRAAGLPDEYVQRTLQELSDHAYQCEQDDDATDKLVDSPVEDLANSFVTSYRKARWYRKLPAFVWILMPIPMGFAVCLSFYCLGLAVIRTSTGSMDHGSLSGIAGFALPWMFYAGKLITPLLAVFLLLKMVSSIGRPAWVGIAATAMLMFFFLSTSTDFRLPTTQQAGGFTLSFSDDALRDIALIGWSAIQAAVVLVVAVIERQRRMAGPLELAFASK